MNEYTLEEFPEPSLKSVIAIKFDSEKCHYNMMMDVFDDISKKFPYNAIVLLPEPVSVESMGKDTLKKWYDMLGELLDSIED